MVQASPPIVGDRYELIRELGAGGMGRVWLARDRVLGRLVAIKEVVPPPGLSDKERQRMRRRSLREARAIARLTNRHVVRVFDVVRSDGDTWIVMEYVPSRPLQDVIEVDGPLPPAAAAAIGLAVLDALVAAHRSGVLHRDVKPANVLLGPDDRVVLTDFGTATVAGEAAVTQTGPMFVSPAYVAPERARHGAEGPAADLWSLGAMLYAAVEGQPPYAHSSSIETLAALISDPVPPARHAGPLAPVLEGLLRKDPEARIDAAEARTLLAACAPRRERPGLGPPAWLPTRRRALPGPARTGLRHPNGPARTGRRHPIGPAIRKRVGALLASATAGVGRPPLRLALISAFAVLLLSMLGWYAFGGLHSGADLPRGGGSITGTRPAVTSAAPSPSMPSPTTPSPATIGPTTSAALALPPGWHIYHDPAGFSAAAPSGWRMSRDGSIVYFREPGGQHRVLGFDHSEHPKPDPLVDWQQQEAYRVAAGDWTDYHRIRLVRVDYFRSAADWDYTYLAGGGQVRVRNRNFITSPTHAYAIYWATPAATWSANLSFFQVVAASFRPAA